MDEKAQALFLVLLGRFPMADAKERVTTKCKDAAGVRRFAESLIDTKEFREHAEGLQQRLGK